MILNETDAEPRCLYRCNVAGGHFELVEWLWPDMIIFERTEERLMLEMSLPPMSADASACFPQISPDKSCFMGHLFIRYPNIALKGRSEGGRIRVMRCIMDEATSNSILDTGRPTLSDLQALLNIRSYSLRSIMHLALRELTNLQDRSPQSMQALFSLLLVEVERIFRKSGSNETASRLAPWQFRRVRERIEADGPRPAVSELASLCGISCRHLHRQFLALTGKSIAGYIEAHHIEVAKQQLLHSQLPLKSIAERSGFAHANSFSRAFRRATGLSPRQFRQHAGSGGSHS